MNCNYFPDVTFLFLGFSLNDAIDFLMNTEDNSDRESSSEEDDHDLAMLDDHDLDRLHPIKKVNADTDMDSDASDGMNYDLLHHLPRRLLN